MAIRAASWVKICMSSSGISSQARKNITDTRPQSRSIMLKTSSRVRLSPFPQYWAPRMAPAPVTALRNIFWTNWIWVARETAVISSWATFPSISASPAATAASIRLWRAIGRASLARFL